MMTYMQEQEQPENMEGVSAREHTEQNIFDHIEQSIDNQDMEKMMSLLSHMRQNEDAWASCHNNIDFAGVLESFLFSIPNENNSLRNEQQVILSHFLAIINPLLVIPTLIRMHDIPQVDLTIVHNLCMEGNHEALSLLLNQLHPTIASREASRLAWLDVDYMDDRAIVYQSDNYYTPMHAAWNGMIFERDVQGDFAKDHIPTSLAGEWANDGEWANLWKTSMYLLLAFDGLSLDLNTADSNDWNIVHSITRYGFGAHATLMWVALRLYPHLAQEYDHDENLALHLAVKQQIFCRSHKSLGGPCTGTCEGNKRCPHGDQPSQSNENGPVPMDMDVVTETDNITEHEKSPISMILESYPFAASGFDKDGRLPLHLLLIHHEENKALLDSINDRFNDVYSSGQGPTTRHKYEMNTLTIVKEMVEANPRALDWLEPSTGLPPFMFAASAPTMSLDIVYTLLLENPIILESYTRN